MAEQSPKSRLRLLARRLYRRGWMEGTAGNLSLRLGPDLLITASGCHKGVLTEEDILRIPLDGELPLPSPDAKRRPSAETSIHRTIYRLFPKTGAVLHVHTIEASLASECGGSEILLPPLEVLKGLGVADPETRPALPVFENDNRVPEIARAIGERLPDPRYPLPGLLIRHHGTTVWGETLDEALRHLELLEFSMRFLISKCSLESSKEKRYPERI